MAGIDFPLTINGYVDHMSTVLVFIVRLYKRFVSPFLPRTCRFYPTCSEYMAEAISKKGVVKGLAKGIYRIFRCNPFNPGGYDPVK